jgi:hypothetical protein
VPFGGKHKTDSLKWRLRMRYFRSLGLTVLTLFVLIFIFAPAATAAYQLGGFSVQYRVYEDGRKFNRYYFEIYDEQGNFIPDIFDGLH